ncbi:MAG: hypothetical protein ACD_10C00402G0001 [uncultured bacterium]|nr:MAG: hypothetical protein ACD_10C00402G0001 [uncultured bacterium]
MPLRVEVKEQRDRSGAVDGGAEIECGGRFADPAFLIEYGNAHGFVVLYKALFFT